MSELAEKLLLDSKPNLFAINSDYKPSLLNGDAYMSVCWTGDAKQPRPADLLLHADGKSRRLAIAVEPRRLGPFRRCDTESAQ